VLVLNPVDGKAAYPILREAQRWNVPVISLDHKLVSMPVRGHIAVNEVGLGEEAARYVVGQIGYKGHVFILEGPVGVESLRNIAIGIYGILDEYPDEIRVSSRPLELSFRGSTPEQLADAAFDLTDRMLKNYAGNIQAIIAVDSTLAVGAVRGVQLHGLTDQVITVGIGAGEEACRQIILKQHDAEVDLMPYERGLEALKASMDALKALPFAEDAKIPNGEVLTETKFGPSRIITSANSLVLERMWPNLFIQK
jgi:ABC-type sugar transport system substrate-binding protein